MSVENIFSSTISEMYHNEHDTQWKCDINNKCFKIYLANERT